MSNRGRAGCWLSLGLFVWLSLQALSLGLGDDEAYYWVLSHHLAWGYAYHPPAVAWFIAPFDGLRSWAHDQGLETLAGAQYLVRLPGILCAVLTYYLGLTSLEGRGWIRSPDWSAGLLGLSLVPLFGLGWMMVPDQPLFLGFTLMWSSLLRLQDPGRTCPKTAYVLLGLGAVLVTLAKFSGILVIFSAAWVLQRRIFVESSAGVFSEAVLNKRRRSAQISLALGWLGASLPILSWNESRHWGPLLFQLRERHQGSALSVGRWLGFLALQAAIAGPGLARFTGQCLFQFGQRVRSRRFSFSFPEWMILAFSLPAGAVYFLQPLWAAYKPHWALIFWWPWLLFMLTQGRVWFRLQLGYAALLAVVAGILPHYPVVGWFNQRLGHPSSPLVNLNADLEGWPQWARRAVPFLLREKSPVTVVGLRYQTAAQAAWALQRQAPRTLSLRVGLYDPQETREEWPQLAILDANHRFTTPVFVVTDDRYPNLPPVEGARCKSVMDEVGTRFGIPSKGIPSVAMRITDCMGSHAGWDQPTAGSTLCTSNH